MTNTDRNHDYFHSYVAENLRPDQIRTVLKGKKPNVVLWSVTIEDGTSKGPDCEAYKRDARPLSKGLEDKRPYSNLSFWTLKSC